MAIWKESNGAAKESKQQLAEPRMEGVTMSLDTAVKTEHDRSSQFPTPTPRRAAMASDVKESVISAELSITGKIEGAGHVRIAGKFDGDVNVQGNLMIEAGATLKGSIRANSVTIGGEVEGNIDSAASVELLPTGVLKGDLKAGTLTVAAGSRMSGRVEFGGDHEASPTLTLGSRQVS